jgi:hypothetical protein
MHIASVVCAFLAAGVPIKVVKIFELSGVCLVADGGTILCTIRLKLGKQLLIPLLSPFAEIFDPGSEGFDEDELRVFMEECAESFFNSDSAEGH